MMSVIEVFIFNLADITELWRALSFHRPRPPAPAVWPTLTSRAGSRAAGDVIESTELHRHRRRQC